ncbi:MAG: dihydrofolate reductase [Candidatus Omnitrophica bacterium]|nr:dihydrofolate reductase [Candidatus Omnitrophota bacterium]
MGGFSIIVAFDESMGIGKGGLLPWHLPADLAYFKKITTAEHNNRQNVVIMGRKTWESIPPKFRPLPGRLNVVISAQTGYGLPEGVELALSLEGALKSYCGKGFGEVFVIGGARVFAEAIRHPLCKKLYLTLIQGDSGADVFFPEIPKKFIEISRSEENRENEKKFSFLTYSV